MGERRELTLGGRTYLAETIMARELFDGPCTRDYRSVLGTAYLAPLAE